ncbi:hypothetical protein [Halomonas sp. GT]|uniref:hypothetical protein n=1 Tax=Halomonas sp. GT TaxID=1971364 RepID=UPI0009F64BF9|nr:hypothetical protein [Halomonas sp. GT]
MKIIFALTLGTIAILLAVTAQDSLITRTLLAAVGLALYAVALIPVAVRSQQKVAEVNKPNGPMAGEFSDQSQQKLLKFYKEPS